MIAQRPRRPRSVSAIEFHLGNWADTVRRAERRDPNFYDDCPCCNGSEGLWSRDALESIIRRGGKQARRLSAAVKDLDERYERATHPSMNLLGAGGWWHHRTWE